MSNENISINGNKPILDLGSNEESKISNISLEKNKQETTENNEEEEKITNPDFDSGKEEITNLKDQLEQKNQEVSLIKTISDKTENEIKTNKRKINDLLNNNKSDPNELPPVTNFSNISDKSETVDKLKKEVITLNKELYKIKTEKNIINYKRLENNYFKNSKEITELKQNNNLLRFQLEDLSRKLNDSSSFGKSKSKNIKRRIRTLKFNKHNNLKKLYVNGFNNNSILSSHKLSGDEYQNKYLKRKDLARIIKNKNELEIIKNIEDENRGLKREIADILNSQNDRENKIREKYVNSIDSLELQNRKLRNENSKVKDKYRKLSLNYNDLEKEKEIFEKEKDELKKKYNEIQEYKNKINEMENNFQLEISNFNENMEKIKEENKKRENIIKVLNEKLTKKDNYIASLNQKMSKINESHKKMKEENESLNNKANTEKEQNE